MKLLICYNSFVATKQLFTTAKMLAIAKPKQRKYSNLGFATTKATARCGKEVPHSEG